MRSFSLVLLRRLLFRSPLNQQVPLYDVLSAQSLSTIERLLLHSLVHEPSLAVRHKTVDTVTDLANNSMSRGRPWHALQQQAFAMAENEDPTTRESAYRVFAGSPNLIMDLQPETVLSLLHKGLEDPGNIEVRDHTLRYTPFPSHAPPLPFHSTSFLRRGKAMQCITDPYFVPFFVVRIIHTPIYLSNADCSASECPIALRRNNTHVASSCYAC